MHAGRLGLLKHKAWHIFSTLCTMPLVFTGIFGANPAAFRCGFNLFVSRSILLCRAWQAKVSHTTPHCWSEKRAQVQYCPGLFFYKLIKKRKNLKDLQRLQANTWKLSTSLILIRMLILEQNPPIFQQYTFCTCKLLTACFLLKYIALFYTLWQFFYLLLFYRWVCHVMSSLII